jgi:tetratricopeptide (TPR) repeat protein
VPPDSPRIAELRRRVHADPASIAFAQLAEEYRRAGHYEEAVKYCRTGLARHPGYLSARVTLGRALIEVGGLDEAAGEFELVLASAPDNLAAIRGMAEIEQRRGNLTGALQFYQRALALARFDSELEETVARIEREMRHAAPPDSNGVSFEQATSEWVSAAPGAPRLIDFDALLASFGTPDATPPAVMEILLSNPPAAAAAPSPILPPPPASGLAADAFAELERELRAFEAAPAPDAQMVAVLAELESWVRVLERERTSSGA